MKKLIWVLPFLLIGMVRAEVVRSVGSLIYKDNVNSRVGINTLSPSYTLDVNGGMNIVGAMTAVSSLTVTGNAFSVGGSTLVVSQGITYPVQIRNGTGGTSLNVDFTNVTVPGDGSILSYTNAASYAPLSIAGYSNAATGPVFNLIKTRSTDGTMDANTVVASGDQLGRIIFRGADGAFYRTSAEIQGAVDGTPGSDDMPGRLTFWTALDGSSTLLERMRIANSGNVGIGNTAPDNKLHISSGTVTIDGTGAPTVGYGLCLATGGKLGHCTTVLGADGTCTCTTP